MKNTNEDLRKTDILRDEREERLERLKNRDGSKRKIRTGVHPAKIFLALLLVAAIALGLSALMLINNGWREVHMTAGMVGDQKVTPLEANFYNGMRFQSMIPTGAFTANGRQALIGAYPGLTRLQTLRDTLLDLFRKEIVEVKIISKLAKEEGTELTQEDKDALTSFEAQVKESAASSQITVDDLLRKLYGPGASMKTVVPLIEQMLLTNRYQRDKIAAMEASEEELQKYAEENADDLDCVDMRLFSINAATPAPKKEEPAPTESGKTDSKETTTESSVKGETESTTESTSAQPSETTAEEKKAAEDEKVRLLQEAKDKAQEMLGKITDEESFKKLASDYAADDAERENIEKKDSTLNLGIRKQNASGDLGTWLFDKARKPGDTTVIDGNGGSAVVYFVQRYRNEKLTFSSRHILVKVKEDANTDLEKAKAEAKAEAERILKEFQDGEKTEDRFSALAQQYSEDPGSKEKGGLYENILPGSFVKPYENWVLESGRKEGDVGIVYAETSSYKGYHIIYFKNVGKEVWKIEAEAKVKVNLFNEWLKPQMENLSFVDNPSGMKLVLPVDEKAYNSAKESVQKVMDQLMETSPSQSESSSESQQESTETSKP